MLLEFAVTNFRSIKERQVLSLIPSGKIRERPHQPARSDVYPNVFALKSAVVYGPNNAGKSNLLKALRAAKWLVDNSNSFQPGAKLEANEFFHFDLGTRKKPTVFELDFIAPDNLRYQYTIEFDQQQILKEALFFFPKKEEGRMTSTRLYLREKGNPIKFGENYRGQKKSIEEELLPNQLFLSKAVNRNQEQLIPVFLFFSQHLGISILPEDYDEIQLSMLGKYIVENKETPIVKLIENLLSEVDSGIMGIEVGEDGEMPSIKFPEGFPETEKEKIKKDFIERFKYRIRIKHRMFDGKKEIGTDTLPLKEQSTGTVKFFNVIQLMLVALIDGDTLVIDELDKSLHSNLTLSLINLFHNEKTNPKNAQLIFTTHDPTLLASGSFGRDQMYFLEKNEFGATEVFSLSSFTGLRPETPLRDWYLSGRFGAIPLLDEEKIFSEVANSGIFNGKN
ncbi:MAG: AAA family ATPase [Bacteroidetes bacterium]|nr:AAA family ATPase [Bacteroidota bacterium]